MPTRDSSAQRIYKGGLHLFFILKIPPFWSFPQQAWRMTGCWVTTMDRAKRPNQTLPCFQALVFRLEDIYSHYPHHFCGCCWFHAAVWSCGVPLGKWGAVRIWRIGEADGIRTRRTVAKDLKVRSRNSQEARFNQLSGSEGRHDVLANNRPLWLPRTGWTWRCCISGGGVADEVLTKLGLCMMWAIR